MLYWVRYWQNVYFLIVELINLILFLVFKWFYRDNESIYLSVPLHVS
jgi:hypothetical protein